jgi:hypothetical protein
MSAGAARLGAYIREQTHDGAEMANLANFMRNGCDASGQLAR